MFGLILLLFSAYLGSSSELDLDIAPLLGRREERGGTRWCNLSSDIHHCYSSKMLSIVCQILGLGHHYHWYHPPPPLFTLINQQSNLPQILHTECGPLLVSPLPSHTYVNVNQEQLFNFVSHHSLPAYRDCSMEIDCLSENWSSCRYGSYLPATRTLEVYKK